jgi:hypothetical protein
MPVEWCADRCCREIEDEPEAGPSAALLDLEQPVPPDVAGPGFLATDEVSPFRDLEE